jgi:hypothetical protein
MNRKLLLRDNLADVGNIPSHGSYYASPDLITHTQVADPQTYFKNNYGSDVSMQIQTGSATNLIYARVKNIGNEPMEAFIHSYACFSSLFLNPAAWNDAQLFSVSGESYVRTGIIQPGEVGVGFEPFVFNAQKGAYCHTGYVMSSKATPDFPTEFKDYDHYVAWIKGCTHATARNHSIIRTQTSSYEQFDDFSNPSATETRVALFQIDLSKGFPVNTKIVVNCEPLGINDMELTVRDALNPFMGTVSGIVPPSFRGIIRTAVFLPPNTSWPEGGEVAVTAFVSWTGNSVSEAHTLEVNHLNLFDNCCNQQVLTNANVGRLIEIGRCSTEFRR